MFRTRTGVRAPATDEGHDNVPREPSPNTGWREVCAILGAMTDVEPLPDGLAAATRPDQLRRYRQKHALGVGP